MGWVDGIFFWARRKVELKLLEDGCRTSISVRDSFTKYAFVEKKKKMMMRNKNTWGVA